MKRRRAQRHLPNMRGKGVSRDERWFLRDQPMSHRRGARLRRTHKRGAVDASYHPSPKSSSSATRDVRASRSSPRQCQLIRKGYIAYTKTTQATAGWSCLPPLKYAPSTGIPEVLAVPHVSSDDSFIYQTPKRQKRHPCPQPRAAQDQIPVTSSQAASGCVSRPFVVSSVRFPVDACHPSPQRPVDCKTGSVFRA